MKRIWIVAGAVVAAVLIAKKVGMSVIERMAEAIKQFEGWGPGTRSYRNNNPGNLKYAGQPGAVARDDQGHAIFDSYESGWNALLAQLRAAFSGRSRIYNSTMTLYEFFTRYAEGNSRAYAEFVARQLGADPTARLVDL